MLALCHDGSCHFATAVWSCNTRQYTVGTPHRPHNQGSTVFTTRLGFNRRTILHTPLQMGFPPNPTAHVTTPVTTPHCQSISASVPVPARWSVRLPSVRALSHTTAPVGSQYSTLNVRRGDLMWTWLAHLQSNVGRTTPGYQLPRRSMLHDLDVKDRPSLGEHPNRGEQEGGVGSQITAKLTIYRITLHRASIGSHEPAAL
jgi:hypothetical protein